MISSEIIKTILIAMAPIGELRVALPLALTMFKLPVWEAYFASVLGNMIPVLAIAFFLEPISVFLSEHSDFFKNFFEKLFHYTRKKHSKKFEVFEEIALIAFVAIPLPMTGAWSGMLAAFVFGIPPKKSIPLILLGVMIAGLIMILVTKGFQIFI
jgi:uncharacterized membrane protein